MLGLLWGSLSGRDGLIFNYITHRTHISQSFFIIWKRKKIEFGKSKKKKERNLSDIKDQFNSVVPPQSETLWRDRETMAISPQTKNQRTAKGSSVYCWMQQVFRGSLGSPEIVAWTLAKRKLVHKYRQICTTIDSRKSLVPPVLSITRGDLKLKQITLSMSWTMTICCALCIHRGVPLELELNTFQMKTYCTYLPKGEALPNVHVYEFRSHTL